MLGIVACLTRNSQALALVQGLLPPVFAQLNAAHIPVVSTWITGIGTALIGFFVSLEILAEAISVGTLFAFSIVDAGVVVLRCVTAPTSLNWQTLQLRPRSVARSHLHACSC